MLKGIEALRSFPILFPVHLFHLPVSELHYFIIHTEDPSK